VDGGDAVLDDAQILVARDVQRHVDLEVPALAHDGDDRGAGLDEGLQTDIVRGRDAAAADEDMKSLLDRLAGRLAGRRVYGGCLCSCNGRGQSLFDRPNHDAQMVQQRLGPLGLAGFFCNGEIGPVGEKSFLHGYTASLALFVKK